MKIRKPPHSVKQAESFNYSYNPEDNSWSPTTNSDWAVAVARGQVEGADFIRKFGRNPDIDLTTDPEGIWYTGGLFNWDQSGSAISLSSSSAEDIFSTGLGALNVVVDGCADGNWASLINTIPLDGTGLVESSDNFVRVNRAFISGIGTYHGSNSGDLIGTINGNTAFTIPLGLGQTQIAKYTVPSGKIAYLAYASVGITATRTATVTMYKYTDAHRTGDLSTCGGKRIVINFDGLGGRQDFDPDIPQDEFPEMTDLWWEAHDISSNDTAVDVNFGLWLFDN